MNAYLYQRVYKSSDMIDIRNTEVEVLRDMLNKARAEAFEYRERIKRLETILYVLSGHVLAGEFDKAQEIAHQVQKFLMEE